MNTVTVNPNSLRLLGKNTRMVRDYKREGYSPENFFLFHCEFRREGYRHRPMYLLVSDYADNESAVRDVILNGCDLYEKGCAFQRKLRLMGYESAVYNNRWSARYALERKAIDYHEADYTDEDIFPNDFILPLNRRGSNRELIGNKWKVSKLVGASIVDVQYGFASVSEAEKYIHASTDPNFIILRNDVKTPREMPPANAIINSRWSNIGDVEHSLTDYDGFMLYGGEFVPCYVQYCMKYDETPEHYIARVFPRFFDDHKPLKVRVGDVCLFDYEEAVFDVDTCTEKVLLEKGFTRKIVEVLPEVYYNTNGTINPPTVVIEYDPVHDAKLVKHYDENINKQYFYMRDPRTGIEVHSGFISKIISREYTSPKKNLPVRTHVDHDPDQDTRYPVHGKSVISGYGELFELVRILSHTYALPTVNLDDVQREWFRAGSPGLMNDDFPPKIRRKTFMKWFKRRHGSINTLRTIKKENVVRDVWFAMQDVKDMVSFSDHIETDSFLCSNDDDYSGMDYDY